MSRSNCNFYSGLQIESMFPFFLSQIFSILRSWSFFFPLFFIVGSFCFHNLYLPPLLPQMSLQFRLLISYLLFLCPCHQQCLPVFIFQFYSLCLNSVTGVKRLGWLPASLILRAIFLLSLKMLAWGYLEAYMKTEQETKWNLLHPKFIILNPVHAKPMVFSEVPQVFSFQG